MYPDDTELVQACLAGRQDAWNTLVERYSRLVYSIPRRYGLSEADAEDVAQTVFLTLYNHLSNLRDQRRLCSWLITTAHRETWRTGRKRGRYPSLDEQIQDVAAPDDDRIEAWERQHLLHEGLRILGGSCEKLLRVLFLEKEELSYEQIAERLGMRVGSIGPTRARCFRKLAGILRKLGLDEPTLSAGPAASAAEEGRKRG